jgi:hypothetical protein
VHTYPAWFSGKLEACMKKNYYFSDVTGCVRLAIFIINFLVAVNELKQTSRLTDFVGSDPLMKT